MADNIQEKIEDKIIDWITLHAGGRLIVFRPEQSAQKLIVEKRGDYKKQAIPLYVFGKEAHSDSDCEKEILTLARSKKIEGESHGYVIFAAFDAVLQDIRDVLWLIPYPKLGTLADKSSLSQFAIHKKEMSNFFIEVLGVKNTP